jgi:predicted amidophosphoribosyltransferase
VTHQERTTARSLSRRVGTLLMRWAICPACGTRFVPSKSPCPECGTRLCPQCNLMLLPEETTCPRCGSESGAACPRCGVGIMPGAPECTACGQPLCPDCSAAVGENDTICAACGAELALVCSECGSEVGPDDATCPHCGTSFDLAPLDHTLERQDWPCGTEDAPRHTAPPQTGELRGRCAVCGKPVPLSSLVCDDCLYRPNR